MRLIMFFHHLLRGTENSDLRSSVLPVNAIDRGSIFFLNLACLALSLCLSFCPQSNDESQSGMGDESITGNLVDAFPDETLRGDPSFFLAHKEI